MSISLSASSQFKLACQAGNSRRIKKYKSGMLKISNFFKSFDDARSFIADLPAWQTDPLDNNLKPGMEILLPSWTAHYLLENAYSYFGAVDRTGHAACSACCNVLFDGLMKYPGIVPSYSIAGVSLPHVDFVPKDNRQAYICLVNLNDAPVITQFWQYKDSLLCKSEQECNDFMQALTTESCLSQMSIKERIEYAPNSAIIYPANMYHSPEMTSHYTATNPRRLLRLSFRTINSLSAAAPDDH
jgi:hypothetical protein